MNKNIIIGASSAGLYSAINLAEKGIRTKVFELRNSIEEVQDRTLIITPEIFKFLNIPEELILNRIKFFEIFSRKYRIIIELREPDIIVNRKDIIKYLENIALKKGIEILNGVKFEDVFKEDHKFVVKFRINGKDKYLYHEFDNLIVANGAKSKVLEVLGKKLKKVFLYQSKVLLPADYRSDTVKIWFDKKYTDYFVWLIPYSEHEGVLGLCVDEGKDVLKGFKKFVRDFNFELLEPETGVTTYYNPLFIPHIRNNGQNIYFTGDAAGHVKMTTVGGTVTGIWGAYCVAKAITGDERFENCYKKLKFELDIHYFIRKVMEKIENDEFDLLLKKVEKKLSKLFYYTPRDRARKLIFKIFKNEPFILYLGAKKLLSEERGEMFKNFDSMIKFLLK